MKTEHFHDLWEAPDNTRLLSKQFSFRFPTHIAAKISALCAVYPRKNRTQIVADLLTAAIDDLEKKLPYSIEPVDEFTQMSQEQVDYQNGEPQFTYYDLTGPRGQFRHLSNKFYDEYEKELGSEDSRTLYSWGIGSKESVEDLLK